MSHSSREPRIYLLPNLMTAGNLACGFFAVLTIFRGIHEAGIGSAYQFANASSYYERAILLIFCACIFDLLDGRLARLGGQDSPFGREFDSIADIISFGMAPALLVSRAVLFDLPDHFEWLGWAIAFAYLLCGAMRLARFNCIAAMPPSADSSEEQRNHDFSGIPIPMAAGFIASLTFLMIRLYGDGRGVGAFKFLLPPLMLGLALLMISKVPYPSFKKVDWRTRANLPMLAVITLIIASVVAFPWLMPAVLFSAYLIYGFIRPLIGKRLKKEIEAPFEQDDPPQ